MIMNNRVIAVEEHFLTRTFLQIAHGRSVSSKDQREIDVMRAAENTEPLRSQLLDLDARVKEMDAIGQDVAFLSLGLPG